MELIAPESYRNASAEEIAAKVNGCGPGGWRFDLVPDDLAGLDVSDCCNCHDWCYSIGGSEADRKEADVMLYLNMAMKILLEGGRLVPIRMAGAVIMYKAVRAGGCQYFGVKS